jgi:AraC family ethanolamine operon transcriptional activator
MQPPVSIRAADCSQVADWSCAVGWDIEYQQVGAGAFDGWFSFASCQSLKLTNQWCNRGTVICGCPPPGMVAVVIPCAIDGLGTYEGTALSRNDAIVLYPGDERVLSSPPGFRVCTISVPRSRFEAALWHRARGRAPATSATCRSFVLSTGRVQEWAGTICSLTEGKLRPAGQTATLELEDRMLDALAMGVCEALGTREEHVLRGARAEYVRRARDYIEAHLEDAILLSRVATYAGVSTRTLELAFRDVLGVAPMDYILTRRLNKVRRHLLNNGRSIETLAGLALEYGLSHFGRFSLHYKTLFGELPSETRRRSQ